jgi:hypothetical protein
LITEDCAELEARSQAKDRIDLPGIQRCRTGSEKKEIAVELQLAGLNRVGIVGHERADGMHRGGGGQEAKAEEQSRSGGSSAFALFAPRHLLGDRLSTRRRRAKQKQSRQGEDDSPKFEALKRFFEKEDQDAVGITLILVGGPNALVNILRANSPGI